MRQGLSKQEYSLRFLLKDLLEGVCGSQAAREAGQYEKEKIWRLLRLVLKLYQCGSSIYLFRKVMRRMYPDPWCMPAMRRRGKIWFTWFEGNGGR